MSDTQRKLIKIQNKLNTRIGTPEEKWGDRRKLRKINKCIPFNLIKTEEIEV